MADMAKTKEQKMYRTNEEFLRRWPTSRGEGWVAVQTREGKLYVFGGGAVVSPDYPFVLCRTFVHNTAGMFDGQCEAWVSAKGPFFLNEKYVFDIKSDLIWALDEVIMAAINEEERIREVHEQRIWKLSDQAQALLKEIK